jgi:hypothetical protein
MAKGSFLINAIILCSDNFWKFRDSCTLGI